MLCAAAFVHAQTPTWAENIAPILYKNCAKCHNPNGSAPFSIIGYTAAYNYRLGIKAATQSKSMPPWTPDPSYRHFAGERILSPTDMDAIKRWVDGGAPAGNLANAPVTPVFAAGSQIQNPDLVLQMPTYTVNTTSDLYRCFVLPTNLPANRFITEIEVVPGNRNIVHHVLAFQDTSGIPARLDAADAGPGYTNFGGTGSNSSSLVMGWVPGQGSIKLPDGMGMTLQQRTNIVFQVHYPGGVVNQKDSTRIFIKFSNATNLRQVYNVPILNHQTNITNGPLAIAANQVKSFNEQLRIPADATLISVAPHMHLIGRRIKAYAVPLSGDTIRLINVPNWDFSWQGAYAFPKLVKLPVGALLKADATYDNTSSNPFNPSNPPRNVVLGESTTDEMMLVYFTFTAYQAGDENITIDSTNFTLANEELTATPRQKLALSCQPNPTRSAMMLNFDLSETDYVNVDIFDLQGDLVKPLERNVLMQKGKNEIRIETQDLASGLYLVRLSSAKHYGIQQFVKVE